MSLTAGTLHSTHSEHRWDAGAASCREDTEAVAIPLTELSQLMMMIAVDQHNCCGSVLDTSSRQIMIHTHT